MNPPQPQQHKGMEHCKDASVVIKGDGVAWIKCDKIMGDCFWICNHGKCPKATETIDDGDLGLNHIPYPQQQPQQDLDGNAIYAELINIEKEAVDLKELEIKIQVLLAGIRHGKYTRSRPSPAAPYNIIGRNAKIPSQAAPETTEHTCPKCSNIITTPKHDAAIIAQAREGVLKEIEDSLTTCAFYDDKISAEGGCIGQRNGERKCDGCSYFEIDGNQLKTTIESLRSTSTPSPRRHRDDF